MQTVPVGSESGAATEPVTPDTFREFMSGYYTGVTVVTSVDAAGRPHGLTCNSLTSITLAPPTLLVCLHEDCGTLAAVRESGVFAVHLLTEHGAETARTFASTADRFASVPWLPAPSTGLPVLTEHVFAVSQCAVADLLPFGDHWIVFGRVVNVRSHTQPPLLYGRRSFQSAPVPAAPHR
ncbi:flavin reductase family protein [Saccharomonospora cyanea]|uniref:DIM6/NTAB family protein n=1 Tax=Saccharomonospora cyanea NA-134 TaxID=882082 RepID=H5XI15_9PSEU|nr:flavin reductase family protein [Saccharomonospora cyanea]EHR60645.1 DIM6/NTAB family protein [Saccharomonospora cyanea NA-134]